MPTVGDVLDVYRDITTHAKVINENTDKKEILNVIKTGPCINTSIYVVNDSGHLKGIITLDDIIKSLSIQIGHVPKGVSIKKSYFKLSPFGKAGDMMRPPVFTTMEATLENALAKMVDNQLNELPVIDSDGKVIGNLNAFELLDFVECTG